MFSKSFNYFGKGIRMTMNRSPRKGMRKRRKPVKDGVRSSSFHPCVEALEERSLLSGSQPIPYGPLPAVATGLTDQQVGRADAVINWNATMLRAIWNAGTPPTATSRVEAMVGVAVYDAVDGVHPVYEIYPVPGLSATPKPDASREAAAIAAADTVLNSLYPAQKAMFEAEYQATLAQIPDTKPKADGIAWGQSVANAVLAWRSTDGSTATTNYQPAPPGGTPGLYELTPRSEERRVG